LDNAASEGGAKCKYSL